MDLLYYKYDTIDTILCFKLILSHSIPFADTSYLKPHSMVCFSYKLYLSFKHSQQLLLILLLLCLKQYAK